MLGLLRGNGSWYWIFLSPWSTIATALPSQTANAESAWLYILNWAPIRTNIYIYICILSYVWWVQNIQFHRFHRSWGRFVQSRSDRKPNQKWWTVDVDVISLSLFPWFMLKETYMVRTWILGLVVRSGCEVFFFFVWISISCNNIDGIFRNGM